MNQTIQWHTLHAKKIRKRESTHSVRLLRFKLGHSAKYRINITIPETLSLTKNYTETVKIFENIHKHVFEDGRSISLDFSVCTNITPESCVVLAAEIDRCLRKKPKSVTGNYPPSENVYLMLQSLGFFNLLKIKAERNIRNYELDPNAVIVPLVSGEKGREELINGMNELFIDLPIYQELGKAFDGKVERALTEGMINTIEHAYPGDFKNKKDCVRRWWRAGFKTDKSITMVLYDQGMGIPNTLPARWHETIKSLISGKTSPDDGLMIKLAMEVGRTSANKAERGKGLPDIKNLIDIIGSGILKIYSYRGTYIYDSLEGESYKNENDPLNGTLIIWVANIKTETK